MSSTVVLLIAMIVCITAYLLVISLMPKSNNKYLKSAMERLEEQKDFFEKSQVDLKHKRRSDIENNLFVRAYTELPYIGKNLDMIEQAGLVDSIDRLMMAGVGLIVVLMLLMSNLGLVSIILAPVLSFFIMYMFVKIKADKRRKRFLDLFPDALDIIIRSVKAGYPINTAIGMVADSMPAEIGYEYIRVMNETSYGYSLSEAVNRFAERLDEPDVAFFSVVIGVQQETGGNLAEVLGNLSNVIRQRKHLRLKINSLSAEGRITVRILIGIAFFMVLAVYLTAPQHFDPLLNTSLGHSVLGGVVVAFIIANIFIRRIINFRI